jgi:hypothetical protein
MVPGFLVFRRDLPGGRFVMLTVEEEGTGVIGRLRYERRADPTRRDTGLPPVIAEAHGATQADVLARLRDVAENDAALAEAMEHWNAKRRLA